MATISGIHILLWVLLWGALIRVYELKFQDSDNILGSIARVLTVVW
jgi:hypothetical protein